MPIFNSLGSNYPPSFVRKSLLPRWSRRYQYQLEESLKERYGARQIVPTYKGRQALFLALKALDLPSKSYVAVNGYTCYAVYQAVVAADLIPYYLDVHDNTLNYGVDELQKALAAESNISAVIIQNTLGFPVEIEAIDRLCKQYKIPLIEDLAHSIGLHYPDGREAGTVGRAAALSFSQDKVVDGVSGGALVWHGRKKVNAKTRLLDLFDRYRDYIYPILTWKIRTFFTIGVGKVLLKIFRNLRLMSRPMDGRADIVQSLTPWHYRGIVDQLKQIDNSLAHRRHVAQVYQRRLPKDIQLPHIEGATYIRFPIRVDSPQSLIKHLKKSDIHVSDIWYDAPVSPARSLKLTNYDGQCPRSEELSQTILNLPTHIQVSIEDAARIAEGVNQWLSDTRT